MSSMKKILLTIMVSLSAYLANAQEYTIQSEGVDNSGNYAVRVVVSTKKKQPKTAEDLVKRSAIHGVMFRGITAAKGYSAQPPIIKDPNVEQIKKDFFDAFWNEKAYNQYAAIVPSSLSVMKNKQTKMTESSALIIVARENLLKYLEKSGIIKGFSNLW